METPWDFHKRTSAFLPWLLTDRPLHSMLPTAQHPVKWQEGQQTERREACVSPAQNRFTLEACPWSSGSEVYWCFSWVLITPRKCGLRAKKKSLDLSPGHIFRDPGIRPLSACLCGLCYLAEAGLPMGASRECRGSGTNFQGLFLARDDSRNLS